MMSYHCSARLVTPREHLMKNVLCAVVAFSVVTAATAQPIVKKNQPEKGYSIKPAAVKVALWSDKNYAIALLPPSLKNTLMLARPAGAGHDWPDARDYTVSADCTIYLTVRSEFNGQADFSETKVKQLTAAGWTEVAETFRVDSGKDENWRWKVFKKDVPAGKLEVKVEGLNLNAMTAFFFKKSTK
jgi:hypothetical protein